MIVLIGVVFYKPCKKTRKKTFLCLNLAVIITITVLSCHVPVIACLPQHLSGKRSELFILY